MKNIVMVAEGKWFGMIDRGKTIKALEERIIEVNPWKDQPPLRCDISYPLLVNVFELLKEQEERWIPVTERLPRSIANKVLVYVQHEDYVGYIGYGHYEKYKGQEMWFDLEHDEEFSKRGYHVTHWMETPMPPMEGR